MTLTNLARQHWAALRALLVFTVLLGVGYPVFVWLVAQAPGLHSRAEGSIVTAGGTPVASALIGQAFTDAAGHPLPRYFQSRPSAAGSGYDPTASGASNLGPESIVDTPGQPSLLTQVCARSAAIGRLEGVDGSRPFCTGTGVGAVLSVIGPRDARGNVPQPTRVVSVNEPCAAGHRPFLASYRGVAVQCATPGEDYAIGQLVPVRGAAPERPQVPADAVTASGSGLDPDISPAYADIQVARVARARHVTAAQIRAVLDRHRRGRELGFLGEPRVDVVALNLDLDRTYPVPR
ncbi:potassium-transporting ATPase subunit C [Mycobacterium sp. pUA109]|uniref:potassium-transporting ATPase subunit C n=1 Tax=Mycobacterium sp. pUA109 TaxID=3238982 RepID=UPI00351ACB08